MFCVEELNQGIFGRRFAIIFLVIIAYHHCRGQIFRDITLCCQAGNAVAEHNEPCNTTTTITFVPPERQALCVSVVELCCQQHYRNVRCLGGIEAALTGQPCQSNTRNMDQYHKDCCVACKFGMAVRDQGGSSDCSIQTEYEASWHVAFRACCLEHSKNFPSDTHTISSNQSVSSIHDKPPPNATTLTNFDECGAFPAGHLCDHQCIDAPEGYYCQCNSGYRLLDDARTCVPVTDRCGVNNPCSQLCTDTGDAVICNCNPGYELQNDKRTCSDIDECVLDEDECDLSVQYCVNTIGSYSCVRRHDGSIANYEPSVTELPLQQVCPEGYEYSLDTNGCKDIDECALGLNVCDHATQYCSNTEGSYDCLTKQLTSCPPGYKYNDLRATCIDVDECAEGRDACNREREFCLNLQGTYECQQKSKSSCPAGYKYNAERKMCDDINECQLNTHACLATQRCDNTLGSYTCVRLTGCGTGYTLNAHTSLCEDDDECAMNNHNCGVGYVCRNTRGSFRCDRKTCPYGYRLAVDGSCSVVTCEPGFRPDASGNCVDYNECETPNVCRTNQRCVNTVGSYQCQYLLNCGPGYEVDQQGSSCQDVDECTLGTHTCGSGQQCINRAGSYICQCPLGYMLNAQRQCEDIDECTRYGKVCAHNSECQNTPGSYICNCKEGFKHGENDKVCEDVDECKQYGSGICQQTCINTWGSYQCTCQSGYTQGTDKRTCTDIDECSLYKGRGNLCIGFCVNEPGSYSCHCPSGYKLGADKRICQDVDECSQESVCRGTNEICLNTRGGYKCNQIVCPPNYIRDTTHKNRCKRESTICHHGDQECINQPLSYSHNFLTFVSNLTIPPTGMVNLFTMRGPPFQNIGADFALNMKSVRSPQNVSQATRSHFQLRRISFNQAAVSLVQSIPGPQDIELELSMKLYRGNMFGGVAVAKIFIYVSEYEF